MSTLIPVFPEGHRYRGLQLAYFGRVATLGTSRVLRDEPATSPQASE